MNISKLALIIAIIVVIYSAFNGKSEEQLISVEYVETYSQVEKVAGLRSQFCKRGATLIIIGQADKAEQYMESFGGCIKQLVQRTMILN